MIRPEPPRHSTGRPVVWRDEQYYGGEDGSLAEGQDPFDTSGDDFYVIIPTFRED